MSLSDDLKALAALRDDGILTPEEFETQKRKLLGGSTPEPAASPPHQHTFQQSSAPTPPRPTAAKPSGPPPPTYMFQAILVTLFCCLPLGIVSIIKASQVSSAFQAGQYDLALQNSKEAANWVNTATICGIAVFVLYCAFSSLATGL